MKSLYRQRLGQDFFFNSPIINPPLLSGGMFSILAWEQHHLVWRIYSWKSWRGVIPWVHNQITQCTLWKGKSNLTTLEQLTYHGLYLFSFQTQVAHQVTQFHVTNWTEDGVCANLKTVTEVNEEVVKVQRKTGNRPILVHCTWVERLHLNIHLNTNWPLTSTHTVIQLLDQGFSVP